MLPESEYGPVRFASDINAARRMFAEYQFDFVIINSPLSDDTGIRFAVDTCTSGSSVTLYLVRADFLDEAQAFASRFGVFTLAKPTSRPMIVTALGWLASAREVLRRPTFLLRKKWKKYDWSTKLNGFSSAVSIWKKKKPTVISNGRLWTGVLQSATWRRK